MINHVKKDLRKIPSTSLISIANSSDPYQPLELKHQIMKRLLPILKKHRVLIITKSDIVKRDSSLLKEIGASVSITITTDDDDLAKVLEPGAPPPRKRIKALKRLVDKGIRVSARVDPIIPFLNEDVNHLIEELSVVGVSHVISSTYKLRYDSWNRLKAVFPECERMSTLYFKGGEWIGGSLYLPAEIRRKILLKIKQYAEEKGMTFSCCREGLPWTSPSCDGSHLIEK